MNTLRNFPVFCAHRRIGFLQSVCLDDSQKRVRALIVSSGMRGKRIVTTDAICLIDKNSIHTKSCCRYSRAYESRPARFACDSTGLLVGVVTDFAIDEYTLCVTAFEILRGYSPQERRSRLWVYSFSAGNSSTNEIIVPDDLGCALFGRGEGAEACAFQP